METSPERAKILQPCEYQLSKSIVHEIKFGDRSVMLIYSDRYCNTDKQFEMFKRGKTNGHDTCFVYISKKVS